MKDNETKEIEKFGQLQENGILIMTIVGEIEGHQLSAQNAKTTKYEHMIPLLAKAEQDQSIKGILILINTIGGDVECGLAIAELIASLGKPTVSLVLGGSHSIGVPLAVAADHSFIVKSATMMIHPVRSSGTFIGVIQSYRNIEKIQDRITTFISDHCKMRKERVFWGLFLVIAGIALVVSKLGYFAGVNLFSLVATVFLVAIIIKSVFKMNFAGILFPLAFIGILFDDQLGITTITPWTVLIAATLGSIGLSIIFPKKKKWYGRSYDYDCNVIDVEDDSHIKLETLFSGSTKYVNSNSLEQVDLKCTFGGSTVYFDNATLKDGKAIVRLDINFAGVELYVPKTWTVVSNANVSLGGIDEKNKGIGNGENILTLVGNVSFSGIEIIYI